MKINQDQLTFRKANIIDLDQLVDYRIHFLKELQGDQSEENEAYLHEQLNGYFREAMENGTFIAFLAEYQQMAIGFSGMVIQSIPGNFDLVDGKQGYILNMYTVPKFRRNRICTDLLKLLIEEGKKEGLHKICLNASVDGFALYKSYGFEPSSLPELELVLK